MSLQQLQTILLFTEETTVEQAPIYIVLVCCVSLGKTEGSPNIFYTSGILLKDEPELSEVGNPDIQTYIF